MTPDSETQQRLTKVFAASSLFDRKFEHAGLFTQQITSINDLYHRSSQDTTQDLTKMAFYEGRFFVLTLRVIQAVLTILILGLTGYGKLVVITGSNKEHI